MKNRLFLFCLMAVMAVSCVKDQQETVQMTDDPVFHATIENSEDPDTRVYADDQLRVLWNTADHVSIFNKTTYNREYAFQGKDGENSGTFKKVPSEDFVTSNPLNYVYSVYPYNENTSISNDGELTVTLPAEQTYRENSFGLGANTMIAVTEDDELMFKNLCGYLAVKLYGDNVSVSSITLKGNNNELLAGKATVVAQMDAAPTIQFDPYEVDYELTLTVDPPVTLTMQTVTSFWFAIPPTKFKNGFKLTVKDDQNGTFVKNSSNVLEIKRNTLKKSAALLVKTDPPQPDNVIYYKSTDGNIVSLFKTDDFGPNLVSNEFDGNRGVITFDGNVKRIGRYAFSNCSNLAGISIPDHVTKIGRAAFENCTGLTDICLPTGVTSIESRAFMGCSSLTSVTLPEGLTKIYVGAFHGCSSLTGIRIPNTVTIIDNLVFALSGLTHFHVPESVTTLGVGVFANCPSLLSFSGKYASADGLYLIDSGCLMAVAMGAINGNITIPYDVTSISTMAFSGCPNLTGVTIPIGVTSIGDYAFVECPSLLSFSGKYASADGRYLIDSGCIVAAALGAVDGFVTLPEDVTALGDQVFYGCTSLTGILIPEGVTRLGSCVFQGCAGLTSAVIPASVTEIGAYVFADCTALTGITFLSTTPPSILNNVFDNTNSAPIYVPAGSVEAYMAAEDWSDYADRILPLAPLP